MAEEVDMTAVLTEPVALHVTPEQYEAMPPNSRIELVDGVLRAMTPPTGRHQHVVNRLLFALEGLAPSDLAVLREQEIRLAPDLRRNPDLLVTHRAEVDLDGYSYRPDQVLLAIEVVSPGTQTTDRLHKPAEYARAGVPHYWRVEISPELIVWTHRLGEQDEYEAADPFGVGDLVKVADLGWAAVTVADLQA
jgi:Uma2 family endonuclease